MENHKSPHSHHFTGNVRKHFSGQAMATNYEMKLSLNMSGKYLLSNSKYSQILIWKSLWTKNNNNTYIRSYLFF